MMSRFPLVLLAGLLSHGPLLAVSGVAQTGSPDAGLRRPVPGAVPSPESLGSGAIAAPTAGTGRPDPAVAVPRALSDAEAAAFAAALKAIDQGRLGEARPMVAGFQNPLLNRYVEWSVLRAAPRGEADFAATWRFLRHNPDWPEPETLRRRAEDRLGPEVAAGEVVRYFTAFPPLTSGGHMRRLEAADKASPGDVKRFAADTWRTATLRPSDETDFLNKYGHLVAPADTVARFDRILRDGRPQVARELLARLPPDYQAVAEARLAMAGRTADAATLLKAVPAARLDEPAMRLERVQWLRRTGSLGEAKTLMMGSSATASEAWAAERQQLARDLLATSQAAEAYAVVAGHGLNRGIGFAEAELLAGWIALRPLKRVAEAQKHFRTLYDGVAADSWRSRAAYWLGRAQEAAGHRDEARDWYTRAAHYGQTFYGQQAARKVPGAPGRPAGDPASTAEDRQALDGRELATVARYLGQAGDFERTRPFLLRLARQVTAPGETALLGQLALDLKRPDVALTVALRGADNGVVLFDAAFPVVDLGATGSVERALALALTRQESAFNAAAVSSSGALGLMQLLPSTARDVATKLGVPFSEDKLTRDPAYNVRLGSQYLADMLQRFGGSYEIALAAYNAGPNRVARWLESIGDPRTAKTDMLDWIESIPLRETRNYVQRIMEAVTVYRDRLNGSFRSVPPAVGRS